MTKPKSPIFSLGAHGTVGNVLTYQRRGTDTIARKKPIPVQPNTLAQQYQRWLYEDYVYRWHQLTASEKQVYQSAGVRFHLTGFQYYMKYMLTNLPDITAWWKMDINTLPTTPDSSRNNNPASVIGASPTTGPINGCFSLDGINDWLNCGNDPTLFIGTDDYTIEFFCNPHEFKNQYWVEHGVYGTNGWLIKFYAGGSMKVHHYTAAGSREYWTGLNVYDLDKWQHFAFRRTGTTGLIFKDGNEIFTTTHVMLNCLSPTQPLLIGLPSLGGYLFHGDVDNFIMYKRALADTTIKRHSERSYPP